MMRRSLAVVFFVLSASLAGMSVLPSASAATLYVGGAGPGNYTTLQAAINASSPGDTVFVYNGTYYENVVVDRTLTLAGEGRDTTTVDGGGIGDVLLVSASWVNVTGFNITNGGNTHWEAG